MSNFSADLDSDPELASAIAGALRCQRDDIELIAPPENIVSRLVLEAQESTLTNKTVEGLPYARYYGGAEFADAIAALTDFAWFESFAEFARRLGVTAELGRLATTTLPCGRAFHLARANGDHGFLAA